MYHCYACDRCAEHCRCFDEPTALAMAERMEGNRNNVAKFADLHDEPELLAEMRGAWQPSENDDFTGDQ